MRERESQVSIQKIHWMLTHMNRLLLLTTAATTYSLIQLIHICTMHARHNHLETFSFLFFAGENRQERKISVCLQCLK